MKRQYVVLLSAALLGLASCGTTTSSVGGSSKADSSSKPSDSSVASSGTSSKTTSTGTSSAGTSSKTTSSAGTSSAGTTSAGTSSQGGTSSAGTSQGTSSTVTPTGTKKIYFEDQPWWNSYADYPMALLTGIDGTTVNTPSSAPTDDKGNIMPGVKMTSVGAHTVSATEIYNFWSIDVDLSVYASITFYRYGDYQGTYYYGGSLTDKYTISELGDNDLYILGATAAWDGKLAATTQGKFDSSMIDAAKEYVTVTLDYNYEGAPAAETKQVEKGKTMAKPSLTRTGYYVDGWYTEAACTNAFNFANLINDNLTLYAHWTAGTKNIWADLPVVDHIVVFAPVSMKYTYVYYWNGEGANAGWPGVLMTVWSGSADWYMVDMSGYTTGNIIFDDGQGGTDHQTSDIKIAESGYHWYVDGVLSTTAPSSVKYAVTFNYNYDGATEPYKSVEVTENNVVSAPSVPSRDGYTFNGWYTEAACTNSYDFSTKVTAAITLYAKWTEGVVSHDNGGALTTWYIRGVVNGVTDWSKGIQMYTDAVSTSNTALYLNITFVVADQFKVTDGTTWYGFDAVDSASTAYAAFKDDGTSNHNISIVTAGAYDIYLSTANKIVVSAHA
jgi:uncharacterized repeat protein (TIGR02543 family)